MWPVLQNARIGHINIIFIIIIIITIIGIIMKRLVYVNSKHFIPNEPLP